MRRTIIVTRPQPEAARWVEALRGAGVEAAALPLIEIAALHDVAPLQAAWQRLPRYRALMFVSAAAVRHFFGAGAVARLPPGLRCWATGPGTATALLQAGVDAENVDAPPVGPGRFDSEALWSVVQAQVGPDTRVLLVRGGDAQARPLGRDWLARCIEAAGGGCDDLVAYRRSAPRLDAAALGMASEAARAPAVWLFSSSEAIANLRDALPGVVWHEARAIATHERIAQAARGAGFGTVRSAAPSLAALVASIESLR